MLNVLLRDFFFCCCSLQLISKCTRIFFHKIITIIEQNFYKSEVFYIHPITPIGDSIFEYKAFFPYIHSPPLTLYIFLFYILKRPLTLNPHNRHSEKKCTIYSSILHLNQKHLWLKSTSRILLLFFSRILVNNYRMLDSLLY